jgi:hypothetical protein
VPVAGHKRGSGKLPGHRVGVKTAFLEWGCRLCRLATAHLSVQSPNPSSRPIGGLRVSQAELPAPPKENHAELLWEDVVVGSRGTISGDDSPAIKRNCPEVVDASAYAGVAGGNVPSDMTCREGDRRAGINE